MLPIYLDISEKAKKIISNNVWYMFDLLLADCEALSYEEILSGIYPEFLINNKLDLCKRVVHELSEMTRDSFERDYLKPIYEYALFQTIEWWFEVTDDIELDKIDSVDAITNDGDNLCKFLNNTDNYIDFLFEDWDFLYVHRLFEVYKNNPVFLEKFLHVNIDEYTDLMPSDIREDYETLKKNLYEKNKLEKGEEALIINDIYSIIQNETMRPAFYENHSEVELSDIIRSILFLKFKEHNLDIERETRGGFAVKDSGELDFYIYKTENGIYEQLAVGENKKWGEYEHSIKQLLGYMTENTKFGFTIIFNKNTHLDTVIKGRRRILEEFNVDGNFRVFGDIKEMLGMHDVLVSKHENPERKGTYFNIYHFIFNVCRPERKISAEQSRKNRSRNQKKD